MNRRELFGGLVASLAGLGLMAALPLPSPAKPHIYLASSKWENGGWLEGWRHSHDGWHRLMWYGDDFNFPYEERLAVMSEQYAWERHGGLKNV
jgi:hypothetical protein